MREKPTSSPSLGIDIEGPLLRGAQLSVLKNKPKLDKLFELEVQFPSAVQDENVKQLYTIAEKNLIISTLKTGDVLVRTLDVALSKEKDIDAVLAFQAEPLLPYAIENAVVDKIIIGTSDSVSSLTIVATRKELVTEHLERWKAWGIDPEIVSSVPVALAAFSGHFSPNESMQYLMHCDNESVICILVEKEKLIAAQATKHGKKDLFEAFKRDKHLTQNELSAEFDALDLSNIDRKKFPELSKAIEQLRLEMTKLLYSLGKQVKGKSITEIMFTGDEKMLKLFPEILATSLQKTVLQPKEDPSFPVKSSQLLKYAVPIGLALTGLPLNDKAEQINFRQQELAYPHPWKRLKQPILSYLGLCLGLSLAIFLFGSVYIKNQEYYSKEKFADLLSIIKKPYPQLETELKKKENPQPKPLAKLTQSELMQRLNFIQKEIEATPDVYPLLPDIPRVSDVLTWLGTLPELQSVEEKNKTPRIHLESFNYRLVKRPEGDKKKEHYQVRVDLEFTTSLPRFAREFHDTLLAPNDFVDTKEGIQWSSDQEKYRASFFLKDLTKYPT